MTDDDVTDETAAVCTGENICSGCGWCRDCERFVGQPHVSVCACPPDTPHLLCPNCRAKRTAWALTAGEHEPGHWWDEAMEAYTARTQGEQPDDDPIDPNQWLVFIGASGVVCTCRHVLISPVSLSSLELPTTAALILDAVTQHLPDCGRALEYDARRIGRGSSFGIKAPSESGRTGQQEGG